MAMAAVPAAITAVMIAADALITDRQVRVTASPSAYSASLGPRSPTTLAAAA